MQILGEGKKGGTRDFSKEKSPSRKHVQSESKQEIRQGHVGAGKKGKERMEEKNEKLGRRTPSGNLKIGSKTSIPEEKNSGTNRTDEAR